ncbi:hypothetical protein Amet_4165 [Alkaliphilus metalliredigens QYMF]|uniref:Lipoprotein n=1 Tax=Alkaliphilus metalliredigens (strain QYMF) TaxID=293826 RepID=A6TVM8_ALKMQ|nr:hypothetical protein [Alkaliphilus metalliredigens]ABR50246.1 hypothetical protein Amet_4165 [Alkaliphilus metalliredigens QYMF]
MKRMFVFILSLLMLATMASCASSNNGESEDDNRYTKEFPYLPDYEESMKLIEFKEGEGEDLDIGTYSIPNTTPEGFLSRYEEILVENGWENTLDNKPISINMKKEEHIAIILVPPIDEEDKADTDIIVLIYAN